MFSIKNLYHVKVFQPTISILCNQKVLLDLKLLIVKIIGWFFTKNLHHVKLLQDRNLL